MKRTPFQALIMAGCAALLLVGALAVALVSARGQARSDLEHSFRERGKLAAALIESTLTQTAQATIADDRASFGTATVRQYAVREKAGIPGQSLVVIGSAGRPLASWPPSAGAAAMRSPRLVRAVRQVLGGRAWLLDDGPATNGNVGLVTGFATPYGRRAAVLIFPRGLIQAFMGQYLQRIGTSDRDDAFLVDRAGTVLSSGSGSTDVGRDRLPVRGEGALSVGGERRRFATSSVTGTRWAVVVTTPPGQLYAPVGGLSAVVPWALLAGVLLLGALVMVLVRGLARGAQRLAAANHDLEVRNAQVVAADQMKSDFLATMSHELRTPLNGIIGFAELMHDGRVGPVSDQHREYLGDILSSSNHLRGLIDDVLDLSKIEAGKLDLRPERVDCEALVHEVCDVVRSLAVRKGITLESEVDPAIGELELDPGKLKQVLFNYLSNALKFTPDGGTVRVVASLEPGGRFRIVVEDDGPGIDDADLGRLWAAFEQLESGSNRRHGGTGLGLSLTRSLVEAQSGEVQAESTVGLGSRFHVVLPRRIRGPVPPDVVAASTTADDPVAV